MSIKQMGTTVNPPSYVILELSMKIMVALVRPKGWRHLTMGDNLS